MDIKQARAEHDRARAELAQQAAAFALGVPVEAINAPCRGTLAVRVARHMAMYLAHIAFEMSLARVAAAFARDRSTVAYACHRIEDLRDDAGFDRRMDDLETSLRAMPEPACPAPQIPAGYGAAGLECHP